MFYKDHIKRKRQRIAGILLAIIFAIGIGYLVAGGGVKVGLILVVLPPISVVLMFSLRSPAILMHLVLILGFLITLLSRYVPGDIPFGLTIDGLLVLVIIALLFHNKEKFELKFLTNGVSLVLLIWLVFSFIEIANPLAKSKVAWFYANRGLSFYPVLLAILTIYLYRDHKYLKAFLIIWAVFSVFGTLWGIKQLVFGVSLTEKRWLDQGAASTHMLFGKLRIFSFYSDAAQFGASQAHTSLVFGILGLYTKSNRYRIAFLIIAALSFYGMLISGTRGALGVLALGGFTYFIMTKKVKIVLIGAIVASSVFIFLKYTTVMQNNYQISRMRTALRDDDPSMMVRKNREAILFNYLADKPIGGGIGSAGYWGRRFNPGTVLANLGTDGHYTRIWMETGIIGLLLYLAMLLTIAIYLGYRLWYMPDSLTRQALVAIYSGFIGVCVASYTNGLLTQIPTGVLIFIGLGLVYLGTEGELGAEGSSRIVKNN